MYTRSWIRSLANLMRKILVGICIFLNREYYIRLICHDGEVPRYDYTYRWNFMDEWNDFNFNRWGIRSLSLCLCVPPLFLSLAHTPHTYSSLVLLYIYYYSHVYAEYTYTCYSVRDSFYDLQRTNSQRILNVCTHTHRFSYPDISTVSIVVHHKFNWKSLKTIERCSVSIHTHKVYAYIMRTNINTSQTRIYSRPYLYFSADIIPRIETDIRKEQSVYSLLDGTRKREYRIP